MNVYIGPKDTVHPVDFVYAGWNGQIGSVWLPWKRFVYAVLFWAKTGSEITLCNIVYKQKQNKIRNGRTLKNSIKKFQGDFYEVMGKSSITKTEGSTEPLSSYWFWQLELWILKRKRYKKVRNPSDYNERV